VQLFSETINLPYMYHFQHGLSLTEKCLRAEQVALRDLFLLSFGNEHTCNLVLHLTLRSYLPESRIVHPLHLLFIPSLKLFVFHIQQAYTNIDISQCLVFENA
jgi:hypothetical protein